MAQTSEGEKKNLGYFLNKVEKVFQGLMKVTSIPFSDDVRKHRDFSPLGRRLNIYGLGRSLEIVGILKRERGKRDKEGERDT